MLRGLVAQWVEKAEVDYRAADRLHRDPEPVREAIAFHCQQVVEKYMKAFLVRHQVEFPKTHNLGQLLDLIARVAPDLAASLEFAEALTPYGVEIRYPGDFPEIPPGQEAEIFELASRAREVLKEQLNSFLFGNGLCNDPTGELR